MPDATADLLWSIDNEPHKWERKRVVAFVPHERHFPEVKDADGKTVHKAETVRVTEADLHALARETNDRIARTGQLDALTIGHRRTEPDFPEKDQPPLVGFCRGYAVEMVNRGKGPMLALTYDEYAAKDKVAEFGLYREYPYRSVDYAPGGLGQPGTRLNGVAALKRPPALTMGTVYTYQGQVMNDQDWTPDDDTAYGEFKQYAAKWGGRMKKYMAKYEAECPPAAPTDPAAMATYQAEQRLKTYQAEVDTRIKALEAQNAAANKRALEAECGSQLDRIAHLVKFDRNRELAVMVGYQSDADRAGHVSYILGNYEKLPSGVGHIRTYEGFVSPGGTDPNPDLPAPYKAPANHDQVMAYVRANPGTSYDQAASKCGK